MIFMGNVKNFKAIKHILNISSDVVQLRDCLDSFRVELEDLHSNFIMDWHLF